MHRTVVLAWILISSFYDKSLAALSPGSYCLSSPTPSDWEEIHTLFNTSSVLIYSNIDLNRTMVGANTAYLDSVTGHWETNYTKVDIVINDALSLVHWNESAPIFRDIKNCSELEDLAISMLALPADTKGFKHSIAFFNCRSNGDGSKMTCCDPYTGQVVGIDSVDKCVQNEPPVSLTTCPEHQDSRGTVWDEATPASRAVQNCSDFEGNLVGSISRHCTIEGIWGTPFYDCVHEEFSTMMIQIKEFLVHQTSSGVEEALAIMTIATDDELLKEEIRESVDVLETIVNISKANTNISEAQIEAFFNVTDNLLDKKNKHSWNSIIENIEALERMEHYSSGGFKVIRLIDDLAEIVADSMNVPDNKTISRQNIDLEIVTLSDAEEGAEFIFPPRDWLDAGNSNIYLSNTSANGSRAYVTILYRDLTGIVPGYHSQTGEGNLDLNSAVLSMTLLPRNHSFLREPVQLSFGHLKNNYHEPNCSYWNFKRSQWDSDGCSMTSTSDSITHCQCSHLTNFAILMSPWLKGDHNWTITNPEILADMRATEETMMENVNTVAIDIISYVGCSLSSLCLLITVGVHMFLWSYLKSERVVILIHLSVSLVISYIVFLAGVRQTGNQIACSAVAMLLQYIYLVVFLLMLAEGIELGVTFLYVYPTKSRLKWLLSLAWGLPAVIVGIAAGITKLHGYGTKSFCWLSTDNALIWSFAGPALVIILINLVILILVMRTMFQTETMKKKSTALKSLAGVRCLCVLLPLTGISWSLGLFYVSEKCGWIQYVFALFNSLQGVVIFIFHCLRNEKVHAAIKSRRQKYNNSYNNSVPTSRTKPTSTDQSLDSRELCNLCTNDQFKWTPRAPTETQPYAPDETGLPTKTNPETNPYATNTKGSTTTFTTDVTGSATKTQPYAADESELTTKEQPYVAVSAGAETEIQPYVEDATGSTTETPPYALYDNVSALEAPPYTQVATKSATKEPNATDANEITTVTQPTNISCNGISNRRTTI